MSMRRGRQSVTSTSKCMRLQAAGSIDRSPDADDARANGKAFPPLDVVGRGGTSSGKYIKQAIAAALCSTRHSPLGARFRLVTEGGQNGRVRCFPDAIQRPSLEWSTEPSTVRHGWLLGSLTPRRESIDIFCHASWDSSGTGNLRDAVAVGYSAVAKHCSSARSRHRDCADRGSPRHAGKWRWRRHR